jgi:hypothetical protein
MYPIQIDTPQRVVIGYTVASVGDRILAYLIDLIIVIIFIFSAMILFMIAGVVTGFQNRSLSFSPY